MENENKEKTQAFMKEWNEKQIYETEILPKVIELTNLLEKHKIPFLFHAVASQYKEEASSSLIANNCGKVSLQVAMMGICAKILDGDIKDAVKTLTTLSLLNALASKIE